MRNSNRLKSYTTTQSFYSYTIKYLIKIITLDIIEKSFEIAKT